MVYIGTFINVTFALDGVALSAFQVFCGIFQVFFKYL